MSFATRRGLVILSTLTALAVSCGGCVGTPRVQVTQSAQVTAETPPLLERNPDGTLKHPCPRASLPVVYVDPVTGRATTSVGELERFGQESDGFITVCEGRVALADFVLDAIREQQARVQAELRTRRWWERLTPWSEK